MSVAWIVACVALALAGVFVVLLVRSRRKAGTQTPWTRSDVLAAVAIGVSVVGIVVPVVIALPTSDDENAPATTPIVKVPPPTVSVPEPAPTVTPGKELPLYRADLLKGPQGRNQLLRFLRSHDGDQVRLIVGLSSVESGRLDADQRWVLLREPCPEPGIKCMDTQLVVENETADSGLGLGGGGLLYLDGYFLVRDLPGFQMGIRTVRLKALRYAG
jgi:hypothetical protein